MASWLTKLVLRYPRSSLSLLVLATLIAALGSTRLRSANFLEGHARPNDPEIATFKRLVDEFGGDQMAIFALSCMDRGPCKDVFEAPVLRLLGALSDHAASLTGVAEVTSLTTTGVLVGDTSGLGLQRLGEQLDEESIRSFRSAVEKDPLLRGTVVSRDLRISTIAVRFEPNMPDDGRNQVALAMRDQLSARAAEAGFDLLATGHVLRIAAADAYVRRDLTLLTPVMLLILGLLLFWVFRDGVSVALALLAVALPTVWAFGLMCWTGRPVTPIVSTMPVLILVVGVTDAVHFLVRVHDRREEKGSIREILLDVVREVGPPTTLTAFAAALGFLSFVAAGVPNLRDFGLFAGLGVLGAWFTTFTLLPIALVPFSARIHVRVRPAFQLGDRVLASVSRFAMQRPGAVLVVGGLTALISLVGILRIVADNDALKLMGEGDPLVRAERLLRDRLQPLDAIEVMYEAPAGKVVTDLAPLEHLVVTEEILKQRAGGTAVVSILPLLRVAHRELVDGTATLPRESAKAAQLLLLAESADAAAVRRLVTPDRRVARLSAGYGWVGSRAAEQNLAELQRDLETAVGRDGSWSVTGTIALAGHIANLVLEGQIASFSTAFLTIFALIFVFVRSLSLGALGMVPNVFPVAVILGFMGFAAINLDVGTAMIASIVLGVSVDDTVYFLLHYQKARKGGATVADSVAYTFTVAGKPALFCAGILALGFFVLCFSSFASLAIFGLLSGVAVFLAALAELFLMPALLAVTAGRRE
jgi:predicted RND superfamily exporter protein